MAQCSMRPAGECTALESPKGRPPRSSLTPPFYLAKQSGLCSVG